MTGDVEVSVGGGLVREWRRGGGRVGLAGANKVRFIPALRLGDPIAASHLSKSIYLEWFVILTILGTTAVLTTNLTLPI